MQQTPSSERIDRILASLDKAQPVPAPPYFYTRLRARLDRRPTEAHEVAWLRPVPLLTLMIVLLLVNFWLINTPITSSPSSTTVATVEPEDEWQVLAFEERAAEHTITEYDITTDLHQQK